MTRFLKRRLPFASRPKKTRTSHLPRECCLICAIVHSSPEKGLPSPDGPRRALQRATLLHRRQEPSVFWVFVLVPPRIPDLKHIAENLGIKRTPQEVIFLERATIHHFG